MMMGLVAPHRWWAGYKNRLKERGVLKEPIPSHIPVRKRQRQRPYAIRKSEEYLANEPGDIVEVDTLDVRPLPGIILKHFTAHDVISRWDVVSVHSRANASTAAHFLDSLESRTPFPVRVIQVDGGAEFEAILRKNTGDRVLNYLFYHPARLNSMVAL